MRDQLLTVTFGSGLAATSRTVEFVIRRWTKALIPHSVLAQILQDVQPAERLGVCAVVSTAFAEAAAVATRSISCSNSKQTGSLQQYLDKHGRHVWDLTYTQAPPEEPEVGAAAAAAAAGQCLKRLPCPNLQQLQLADGTLQLGPALLHAVTGLTKLSLTAHKGLVGGAASLAALSALPSLQDLSVKLSVDDYEWLNANPEVCDFLAASVLRGLTKLTALDLDGAMGIDSLHPVTCLSALQSLSLKLWYGLQPAAAAVGSAGTGSAQQQLLSRPQHSQQLAQQSVRRPQQQQQQGVSEEQQLLQQLTRLVFSVQGLEVNSSPSSSCPSFAGLTALQHLHLEDCVFNPAVLGSMHNLQHLNFALVRFKGHFGTFLSSLGKLQHLAHVALCDMAKYATGVPPAAYAALTSSSKLGYFYLTDVHVPPGALQYMFPAQRQLPCLRSITLQSIHGSVLATDDLERIVSSCPNLDRLILMFYPSQPPQQPDMRCLAKLTQLRFLQVNRMQGEGATVLPQLTNLRMLNIYNPGSISITRLLQLTRLTELTRMSIDVTHTGHKDFKTKAPEGSPPDVWYQVLQACLRSEACQDLMLQQQPGILQRLQQAGKDSSAVKAAIDMAQARAKISAATQQLRAAQLELEKQLRRMGQP